MAEPTDNLSSKLALDDLFYNLDDRLGVSWNIFWELSDYTIDDFVHRFMLIKREARQLAYIDTNCVSRAQVINALNRIIKCFDMLNENLKAAEEEFEDAFSDMDIILDVIRRLKETENEKDKEQ